MEQKKPNTCKLCIAQAKATVPLLPNRSAWSGSPLETLAKDVQAKELARDMVCVHEEKLG